MSAENRTRAVGAPAPAPAPANAYAAPPSESGEPRGAAGEVVHWVLLCACTADCPRGVPLSTRCWLPCSLPCSFGPHLQSGPSLPSPVQTGTAFALQSRRASPASNRELPADRVAGDAGGGGEGRPGRKPGRSNDTSRFFFFFKPLLLWAHPHDTFGAVFESYDQILILWQFCDIPER